MSKRNKKKIRRRRHAKRLSKIISNARERAERLKPADDIVLRGAQAYGISQTDHLGDAMHSVSCLVANSHPHQHRRGPKPESMGRWAYLCVSVDFVPVVVQAKVRGRRTDQLAAEMRENRSRIKHGDVR